jgi:peptidoglycan/xylan/chitin deacetylase (PgdA/CDA1 family)
LGDRFEPAVLCYHAVSDRWDHILSVRPLAFERQLRLMLALRYTPASAADVAAGRRRLLHVTFDDAYQSVWNAVPVLDRLGVRATVFVCTSYADGGRTLAVPELAEEAAAHPRELATMDWDSLAGIADRGIEIGSHTKTHPHLTSVSDSQLREELHDSRERLEDTLGVRCRFLAYPYGDHDDRVRVAAGASGYEGAFALPGRDKPLDRFALPRVGIWRQTSLLRTMVKTSPVSRSVAILRGWR